MRTTTGFVLQMCFSNFIGFGHPRASLSPSANPDPNRTWRSTRPWSIPPTALCVSQASPGSLPAPQASLRPDPAPSAPTQAVVSPWGCPPASSVTSQTLLLLFQKHMLCPRPAIQTIQSTVHRVQPNINISHGVHCFTDKERILVPGVPKVDKKLTCSCSPLQYYPESLLQLFAHAPDRSQGCLFSQGLIPQSADHHQFPLTSPAHEGVQHLPG